MKRILVLMLAMVMLLTTAMPTLALSEITGYNDPSPVDCVDPLPDDDGKPSIEEINELARYIDLDDLEEWAFNTFWNEPTTSQALPADLKAVPFELLDALRDYLWYDCPRLFHCKSCGIDFGSVGGKSVCTAVRFSTYYYTASDYHEMYQEVLDNAEYFLDGVKGNNSLTDLQKITIIHDRMVDWTEYDFDNYQRKANGELSELPHTSYDMYGAIVMRDAVCKGFSLACEFLLRQCGIELWYANSSGLNHAWNVIILDGNRYFMDATWDDSMPDMLGKTKHDYLLNSNAKFGHYVDTTNQTRDYEYACNSNTYDTAFWQNCDYSPMQLVNNDYVQNGIYYINSSTKQLMRWSNATDLTGATHEVICSTGDTYSVLASDGERLFFTKGRTVYEWDFATQQAKPYWTLPASLGTSYKIYGINYDNRDPEDVDPAHAHWSGDTGSKLWVRAHTSSTISRSSAISTWYDNIYEVPMNSEGLESYSVTVTNGTATPSTAMPGETVTIKANTAASGMVFDKWTVDSGSTNVTLSYATSSSTSFVMPNGNVSLTATYKTKPTTMPATGYGYLVNGDFGVENMSASDFGWKIDKIDKNKSSVSGGVATITNGNETRKGLYEMIAFIPGHNYTITGTVADLSGDLKLYLDDTSDTNYVKSLSNGSFTHTFTATEGMDRILFGGWKSTYKLSNITLKDNTLGDETSVSETTTTQTSTTATATQTSATASTTQQQGGTTTGTNLFINGDFMVTNSSDSNFGWKDGGVDKGAGQSTFSAGSFYIDNGNSGTKALYQMINFVPGTTYTLTLDVNVSGTVPMEIRLYNGSTKTMTPATIAVGTSGTQTFTFTPATAADRIYLSGTDAKYTITRAVLTDGTGGGETTTYTVTVTNGTAGKTSAAAGDTVNLTAGSAPTGYTFDKWTSSDVTFANANNANTSFVMPAKNVAVTANFKKVDYTVSVTNGSASKTAANMGDTITISANAAASGYEFDKWVVKSGSTAVTFADATSMSTTFTMPAGNVSVEATYSEVQVESDVPTPQGVKATVSADGVTISWNAVEGASGYRVFKKVNGSWNTVKTLNDGTTTSYNVVGLNAGETYTFTVQAFVTEGSETTWSQKSSDVTATPTFGAPDVGNATVDGLGIKITWAKVNGATGYRIYRRTVENQTLGSWKTVNTLSNNNTFTYTDTSAVIGVEYAYTVQAYTGSGDTTKWSTYDPLGMRGRVILATPTLGSATKVSSGATVSWSAVTGATGYRLYRWNGSAWKTVKTVLGATTVSYTDTNSKAVAGAKYTVQAFHVYDGVLSWSGHNEAGVTVPGGSDPNPPAPTLSGSADIDLVTLTYFDDACTEYGVSFHSFANMTSPTIQIVQGVATGESSFNSAREIAVTDNYTKEINAFENYSKTTYEYDYKWENRSEMFSPITTYIHQGVIDNLSFNTTYSYRVGDSDADVWSEIYTFTTRPENVGNFSLIYTADTQPENSDKKGWKGVSTIFSKALSQAPTASFFVSGGDFVYCSDDGMSTISPWRNTINGSNNLFGSDAYFAEHPWFVANGNHDNNYVQYFFNNDTVNTSTDYYSYDYGDVHFIVLDSGHNGELDTTQINWLRTDLSNTQKKFKVVFLHWPFYCHNERDMTDATSRSAIDIFEQYDVDFVISAHVNEDYYTTYPLKNDAIGTSSYTTEGDIKFFQGGNGPIYLQNAGSGMDGNLSKGGEKGVMFKGKNDGGLTCSYPDLMLHETKAGYEASFLIMSVDGNKLSVNRYYLDEGLNPQRYDVGQVGVIKN